jgi:DNA topoisomerase VI subunit B
MRQHFTISRSLEYFTESELTKQMGVTKDEWLVTLIKELIDNALDAAETIGTDPVVKVSIDDNTISVMDNGPGIPEAVVMDSVNFDVRVSDKSGYVSPSRGQQGNALMCLYAVPFVLDGDRSLVEIHTGGTRFEIDTRYDQIQQAPVVTVEKSETDFVETGTFIKIHCSLIGSIQKIDVLELLTSFSICNPHADFTLDMDGEVIQYRRTGNQTKWTPAMPLVCHWYDLNDFIGLIARTLHKNPDTSVNNFLSQFDGLKAPPKQKAVCGNAGISSRDGMNQFVIDGKIDHQAADRLLDAMNATARDIKPAKLGTLDLDHAKAIVEGDIQHRSFKGVADGLPFTVDVFFLDDPKQSFIRPVLCLNNSVLINGRIESLHNTMWEIKAEREDNIWLFIHIACPKFNFMGKGKNTVQLPGEMLERLKVGIVSVTKEFTKKKKRIERERAKRWKPEKIKKPKTISQIEAAFMVMEAAYMKASDNNTLPAKSRQVYYPARPGILQLCGIDDLSQDYFRKLIRRFERENPDLTKDWDIIYDARGALVEPYTNNCIPLGTVDVRNYINGWSDVHVVSGGRLSPMSVSEPVVSHTGHHGLYKYALFIEKEGFEPLIRAAKIQEKYGIALLSTKGMSTFAARDLIERLSSDGVTIFVLHDFDKAGFIIARNLSEDSEDYQFNSDVNIVDLGFRLEDIEGLEREPVVYSGRPHKKNPKESIIRSGATPEEADILVQGGRPNRWTGERVELNAMTSRQLVDFIEAKLTAHGVEKVVPDNDTLVDTYKKIQAAKAKSEALDNIMARYMPEIQKELSKYDAPDIAAPDNLPGMIRDMISGTGETWEDALYEVCR